MRVERGERAVRFLRLVLLSATHIRCAKCVPRFRIVGRELDRVLISLDRGAVLPQIEISMAEHEPRVGIGLLTAVQSCVSLSRSSIFFGLERRGA